MKYFGTDGIRGVVGRNPITPQFFTKIGWALGQVFGRSDSRARVLIGKDTRISGYMFESALQAGLAAAGTDIMLVGPMPTPAIAYLTRTFSADVGVVISASHNGYLDNGIKFFSNRGTKLDDDMQQKLEEQISKEINLVDASELGRAARVVDARGRYIEFCKSTLPRNINIKDMNLVVDCANGATYSVAGRVFSELGANITLINNQPDGLNINKKCGSTYPEFISKATVKYKGDIGIAFDGDGDRVIMCDKKGKVIPGDAILYILAKYMQKAQILQDDIIVGTEVTNYGLELSLQKLGIKLKRVKVGDRHIIEELVDKGNGNLGGESSGHIVCSSYTTTGDGIITALQVLAALSYFNLDFTSLIKEAELIPMSEKNLKCNNPKNIMKSEKMHRAINEAQQLIKSKGRLLVRPSGTEPVLRINVESKDELIRKSTIAAITKVASSLNV